MMLGVIAMLFHWARDPSMWRWLADDAPDEREDTAAVSITKSNRDSTTAEIDHDETRVSGPNDKQPFEHSQAKYLFQAITDKEPLAREEMPAYWKLMRWSMTESFDDLWERSRKDIYFTHLAEAPEKFRGELIGLKISLRRALAHDAEENSAGAKQVYEAWGVTNESRSGLFCLVFYDKPPELAIKPSIHEEATFVGYFLKQFTYEDAMGKKRWAPLLIGRLRWRENLVRSALRQQREGSDPWPWFIVGGGLVVLIVAWKWTRPASGNGFSPLRDSPPDHAAIERWLEDGAPERTPITPEIFADWDGSEGDNTKSRQASQPKDPTNLPIGDVPDGNSA